jgi:hypothetical protein
MEVAIENIVSLTTATNLVVNQLIKRKATTTITTKATSTQEPKWTMVMAKNVRHVVSRVVETLADAPKQEKRKLNLHIIGFEAKEGETKNELVQRLNTELLQGQMKLRVKVVAAKWQQPTTSQASTDGKCTPQRSATQVCNKRGPPGYTLRVQGPNRDQVGPG